MNATTGSFAMPMMKGFPCPVASPQLNASPGTSPKQGLGVGWSHVPDLGIHFFVSIHGADDDVLVAHLDYARYRRLCELLASAGQQALLNKGVDEAVPDDPFTALLVAYDALNVARKTFHEYGDLHRSKRTADGNFKADRNAKLGRDMTAAMLTVGAALKVENPHD